MKRASKKGSSDNVDAEYPEVAESANEEVPDMQPSDDFDVAECTAELLLELGAIEAVEKGKAENSPEKPAAENDDYFPDNQLGLEPTFNNSLEDSYGDSVAGLDGVFKGLHLDIDIEIPATQMTPPGDQTPPSEVVVEASKESAEITPTEPEQMPPSVVAVEASKESAEITPTEPDASVSGCGRGFQGECRDHAYRARADASVSGSSLR